MSGEFSANTDDLTVFVDNGSAYTDALRAIFAEVEEHRSSARARLDGPFPASSAGQFDTHIVQATNSTGFVQVVRDTLLVQVGPGPGAVPLSVVTGALHDAGFTDLGNMTIDEQRALAEWVETEGHILSLNNLITAAHASGDLELAAELEAELEAFHLNRLDPELAHTFIVSRNFVGIFGDDTADVDRFTDVADGERRDDIYDWLARRGITGSVADTEYERILAAAQFFVDDQAALDRLDAGNASDNKPDGDVWVDDGIVNFMTSTAETTDPSEAYFRGEVINGYLGSSVGFHDDHIFEMERLVEIYEGDSVLGPLSGTDQQIVVDAFADVQAFHALNPDMPRMSVVAIGSESEDLDAALRQSYAQQAIRLESLSPVDSRSQSVAHLFASHSLLGLDSAGHAELVSGLTEDYHFEGGSITGAGLFAHALILPVDLPLPDNYGGIRPGVLRDPGIPLYALMGLNDGLAPGEDFTQAQSDFVFALFEALPPWYGEHISTADGRREMGHELGIALGTAAYPDDNQAQRFHGERLAAILMTDEGEDILAVNNTVDGQTRSMLIDTVLYGRMPTEPGHAYHYTVGPPATVFWTASDFTINNAEKVTSDFAVDTARAQIIANTGRDITPAQERNIRALVTTDQGMDLVGFEDSSVDYLFRNQFISVLLSEPGWTVDDFSGEGSGLDNPMVNAELAVAWAQATQPGVPLTEAEEAQIREIGRSEEWIDNAGAGVRLSGDTRSLYLAGALANGWTSETFGLTDDFTLNTEINLWISRPHLRQFETDEERAELLAAMAEGDTESYVLAVLGESMPDGLDGMHPALAGRLDSTINEINSHRADDAAINAVPVFFNTGDLQVQTYLFETTDSEGRTVYIDMAGEYYSSVNDWYNASRLPPGQVTFTGTTEGQTSNSQFVSPLTGEDYSRVTFTTEDYVDTVWEHAEPWVVGGTALIGGVVFFINPVAGGAILSSVGAYQVGKGVHGLHQLHQHGGEIDWSDPRFRGDVLNIAEGGLSIATAGGAAFATRSAQRGYTVGRWATRGLGAANLVEGSYSAATVGYQAYQILESDLPASEKAAALSRMGLAWTAQGLVPVAVGRGIRHLPFTTSNAYHPGITQEMFDAAQAAGIDDPLHIAMYAYLNDPASFTPPNSPERPGVGPAVAVAGHNVGGQPFLSDIPPRLVGSGGLPSGHLNVTNRNALSLQQVVNTRTKFVADGGGVVQQEFAFIEGANRELYLERLSGLFAETGTPIQPEIRANIERYIDSHAVDTGALDRNGNPILEYWIPVHAIDPSTGATTVYGSIFPGTHADVVAANQALADARRVNPSATLADVTMLVHSRSNTHQLASCPNCSGILADATIISGTSEAWPQREFG